LSDHARLLGKKFPYETKNMVKRAAFLRWHHFVSHGTLCAHPASLEHNDALQIKWKGTNMDEILTANEAAALLKVHKRTVYRLAEQGIIPGNRIGHRWRFNRMNIMALVSKPEAMGSMDQNAAQGGAPRLSD
jgi:excisionase family DNA binding protein